MPSELRLIRPVDAPSAAFAVFRNDVRPTLWAAGLFAVLAAALVGTGFAGKLDPKIAAFGGVLLLLAALWLFASALGARSARYTLTATRIEIERGFISRRFESVDLWRVRDLVLDQWLLERLRGVGRITVYSSDQVEPTLTLGPAANAKALYDDLRDAVSAARKDAHVVPVDSGR